MQCIKTTWLACLAVFAFAIVWGTPALADQGTLVKYSQLPGFQINPDNMFIAGENIPSDVDWNLLSSAPPTLFPPPQPNWIVADDFRDPFDTPVLTVRWWGSYVGPTFGPQADGTFGPIFGPGSEDGYVLSFFTDRPADPTQPFSRPEALLATYIAPLPAVKITPTNFVGWDEHPIFQYEVNLQDTHLEHAVPGIADPIGFNQQPGEVYWLAINAEVGHTIVKTVDPLTGQETWVEKDTGKFVDPGANPANPDGHFWGWHTSPEKFNDIATMGHLVMGPNGEWIYPRDLWRPIQPEHGLTDMAFQLLTIPEPASAALIGSGLLMMYTRRRLGH